MGNFYMLDTYTPDVFSTDVRNVTFCLLDGFSKVKKKFDQLNTYIYF